MMEVAVEVKNEVENEATNFLAAVWAKNLGRAPEIAGGLDPVATSVREREIGRVIQRA